MPVCMWRAASQFSNCTRAFEETTKTVTTTQTFPAEASGKTEPLLRLCPAEVLV
jgi:hypothetical protein